MSDETLEIIKAGEITFGHLKGFLYALDFSDDSGFKYWKCAIDPNCPAYVSSWTGSWNNLLHHTGGSRHIDKPLDSRDLAVKFLRDFQYENRNHPELIISDEPTQGSGIAENNEHENQNCSESTPLAVRDCDESMQDLGVFDDEYYKYAESEKYFYEGDELASDEREDSDEYEVDSEYESNEEEERELAPEFNGDGQYLNKQSSSEDNSDGDVEKVVIHQKKNSQKRYHCQVYSDNEEEASTSGHNNKKHKITKHNKNEHERRAVESVLFEELAQDDEDEEENEDEDEDEDDNDDESLIEARYKKRVSHSSESYDDDVDLNMIPSNGYLVAEDSDEEESDSAEDNPNGFNRNSLRFYRPDGTPWANDKEREDFFDYISKRAEEDEGNENETDDESDDSNASNDDKIIEGYEDVLKFFELHDPDNSDPAEMERLKKFGDIDNEDLSEEAKEDARKTRILVQSVYSVATILHKFPLEKALKLEKKAKDIKRKCARLRAALIANGFPEDKLPPTITKKKKKRS